MEFIQVVRATLQLRYFLWSPRLELSSASLHLANSYSLGCLPTHTCLLLMRDWLPSGGGVPKHPVFPQPRIYPPLVLDCNPFRGWSLCPPCSLLFPCHLLFSTNHSLTNVSPINLKCSGPFYRGFQLWSKYCPYTSWLPHIPATLPPIVLSTPSINLDWSLFSRPLLALLNTTPVNWFASQMPPN